MYKYVILIFILTFAFSACNDDEVTEPDNQLKHDQALFGVWELTACKLEGNITSSENFSSCPVKIEFVEYGSGTIWTEAYGATCGCKTFSWNTQNDQLTIHKENEYPFVSTYSIIDTTLTLSFFDNGNIDYIYNKE